VPQIWLTFEEIADLFYCDTAGARRRVIANQWERRRYSDGVSRALLPPEVAHEFMLRHKSKHESVHEFDAAMAALRRVFSQTEVDYCKEVRQLQPASWHSRAERLGRFVRVTPDLIKAPVVGRQKSKESLSPNGSLCSAAR
jgi:hypothetical protein